MKLAVFDIDGTLTLGDGLGTRCFFSALEELFGGVRADRRLESYEESTDCGIAREAARKALGREAQSHEIERFKQAYLELLAREVAARTVDGQAYRPVPGAGGILPLLASHSGWRVAIATGNWRRAASLKLESARIATPAAGSASGGTMIWACSEDGASRAGVLSAAIACASEGAGERFESVVYVGDQPWDLRAARQVRAGFVGIGHGQRALQLAGEGVAVAPGYEDAARFFLLLEQAAAPA